MSPRGAGLRARLGARLGERARFALPVAEWQIAERRYAPARAAALESVFAVANGYLGLRGTPEEGTPVHDPGVILNGLHETWPIVYPEDAYGLARTGQTIVPAPDGSVIRLFVDDQPVDLASARIVRFERVLDMQIGVLCRELEFETARGKRLLVRSRRLASLHDRHLAAFDYELHALDGDVEVTVCSELVTPGPGPAGEHDPRRGKGFAEPVLVALTARAGGERAVLELATRHSGLELACGMDHLLDAAADAHTAIAAEGDGARYTVETRLPAGRSLRLSKFVAYHWAPRAPAGDLPARVERTLDRARREGYDPVEFDHRGHVERFWRRSDVLIEGAPDVQQAVRFNLFQLMQATARAEGLGLAAKGVTGRGYDGHYFWDTEIYVLPFLIHTSPDWARQALAFRCAMLPAARARARELGHHGALYPWRTINGSEASAWYAAGTAQYHINADIAYALRHYLEVTGDLGFLLDHGAEVLVETARFWLELGFFSDRRDGAFCLNGVTGPDEYTTVVDNNAYTNLMARENLEGAVRVIERLQHQDPEQHARLIAATGLTDHEVDDWRRAAARMHIPRHAELGIVLQDEHFLERKPWPHPHHPDRSPLLLHHHPLELYRHQVIKQTDVVLATYLVEHAFTPDETRRTFDYYDPLTTGDSTLSACIQSIIASAIDYPHQALDYFLDALAVDLLDLHHNTADGIHIASAGGTWLALVAGFGGLRDFHGQIHLAPRLPTHWHRLRFRLQIRGQQIEIDTTPTHTTYRLLHGTGLQIHHHDEPIRLRPGVPVRVRVRDDREELPLAA